MIWTDGDIKIKAMCYNLKTIHTELGPAIAGFDCWDDVVEFLRKEDEFKPLCFFRHGNEGPYELVCETYGPYDMEFILGQRLERLKRYTTHYESNGFSHYIALSPMSRYDDFMIMNREMKKRKFKL